MSKKTKALIYNLLSFAVLFIGIRYFALNYTNVTGIWRPLVAFAMATLVAPKFQAVRTGEGEKIFVKWIFIKGVKEVG
jgi:hypothetical protein